MPIRNQSFVYFIEAEDTEFFKIGCSMDPRQRLMELQTASPFNLQLVATLVGGARKEKEIHSLFKLDRYRGEWFKYSKELHEYIWHLKDIEHQKHLGVPPSLSLQEEIQALKVDTPIQIAIAQEKAEAVKQMAYESKHKTADEITLIAKCHFVQNTGVHPPDLTFKQYFPHWLVSIGQHRSDMYDRSVIAELQAKAGKPMPINDLVLRTGYAGFWQKA